MGAIRRIPLSWAALLVAAAPVGAQAVRTVPLPPPNATLAAEFSLVSAVRELADGRVLIVDLSEKKLVAGDWSKAGVTEVGRNGSGPGEYLQPNKLIPLRGDSTLLPDARNGRWLLLSGSSVVSTIGPDSPALRNGARVPLGADREGRVLMTGAFVASGSMPRRDSVLLVRIARASGEADTLATLKARPATMKIDGPADRPRSVNILTNPVTTGELATLFPDGWIAIARLDPYRIDWVAPDGKRIFGPSLPFERVRLDEREQRDYLNRQAERNGTEVRDPRSYPDWPEYFPPFLPDALLQASDGRLWIRRTATSQNPKPPYDVIDRSGALAGRVAVEKDVVVVGFGRGAVYAARTDESGLQKLQRRPLPRF